MDNEPTIECEAEGMNRIEVCFSPGEYHLYEAEFDLVVVIDVLRATSAICTAMEYGVKEIIPVATLEEARALQAEGYIAAAERGGKIVDGFDLLEEGLELVEGQCAGAVAAGLIGIWVCFEEQSSQANGHPRFGQVDHLRAATAGGSTTGIAALQSMGDIKNHR